MPERLAVCDRLDLLRDCFDFDVAVMNLLMNHTPVVPAEGSNRHARLFMLASMLGCFSPIALFLVPVTCTNSAFASFHRPCFQYVEARLAILIRVSGCSLPSTFSLGFAYKLFSVAKSLA
jgi:hypothetical protein